MDGLMVVVPGFIVLVYIGAIILALRVAMAVLSIAESVRRIANKLDPAG